MKLIKKNLLAIILCLPLLALGKGVTQSKPVQLPGSHISIVLPVGYTVCKDKLGIEKVGTDNVITFIDVPRDNYFTNATTFTEQSFLDKGGVEVKDFQVLKINGYQARYCSITGDNGVYATSLLMGDSTFVCSALGLCDKTSEADIKEIKEALKTVVYDKKAKYDPLALSYFTLDDTKSKYKFAKSGGAMYLYSYNGLILAQYETEPIFIAYKVQDEDTLLSSEDFYKSIITELEENGYTEVTAKEKSGDKINGYETYEAYVTANYDGKQTMLYILVAKNNNKLVMIQGLANEDFDTNAAEFKKLGRTIKFK